MWNGVLSIDHGCVYVANNSASGMKIVQMLPELRACCLSSLQIVGNIHFQVSTINQM